MASCGAKLDAAIRYWGSCEESLLHVVVEALHSLEAPKRRRLARNDLLPFAKPTESVHNFRIRQRRQLNRVKDGETSEELHIVAHLARSAFALASFALALEVGVTSGASVFACFAGEGVAGGAEGGRFPPSNHARKSILGQGKKELARKCASYEPSMNDSPPFPDDRKL